MSFRKNADVKSSSVDFGDLEAGQVVRGVVKRVEAYGAFVRIDGSSINGLCHKSKVSELFESQAPSPGSTEPVFDRSPMIPTQSGQLWSKKVKPCAPSSWTLTSRTARSLSV